MAFGSRLRMRDRVPQTKAGVRAGASTLFGSAPAMSALLLALAALSGACALERWPAEPGGLDGSALQAEDSREPGERSASAGLVYVVLDLDDPRKTDLWRARLSDRALRPLTQTPDQREEEPLWSDRASTLVFQVRSPYTWRIPPRLRLWKGGSVSELPGAHGLEEAAAAWAPFDTRLVYQVRRLRPEGSEDLLLEGIAVVDVKTGEQGVLAGGRDGFYSHPAFAPDNRSVAFEYEAREPRIKRIGLVEAGGELQLLTSGDYIASDPSFTRDGQLILFNRQRVERGPRDIMRMRLDGSDLQPLTSNAEADDFDAVASPVRDEIAFISDRDGKLDVFLVPAAGGVARNLTASLDMRMVRPRWSPDGERLAVTGFTHDPKFPKEGQTGFNDARALVIDREGRVLFQASGLAPAWMPPWR